MRTNEPKPSDFQPDLSAVDISDQQFDQMTEQTITMVETVGLNHKSMMPSLIVHSRQMADGGMLSDIEVTMVAIAGEFSDGAEKRKILRNLGAKFYADKKIPCAIFMATEAWASFKATECLKSGMMPSQDPERKEVLMIAGRTISGDCKVGVFIQVRRDSNDLMIRDGENEVFKNKEVEMSILEQFLHGFFEANRSKTRPRQ